MNHSVPPGGEDYDENVVVWVTLARVYPPNDIIIESLLRSQEIPYRVERNTIAQIPLPVGPYAETVIQVPRPWEEEALKLLEPAGDLPEEEAPVADDLP